MFVYILYSFCTNFLVRVYYNIKELNDKLKACVRYFLSNFYFSSNDSPSNTMKSVFISSKKPLSAIALEVEPREMFIMSLTV